MTEILREKETSPPAAGFGFRLRMAADGRLWYRREPGAEIAVSLRRCFPWSNPLSWLVLKGDDGNEVALIESAGDLDPESRAELVKALEEAAFVFVIESIMAVDEEFELRRWRVRTKQGERLLQTRMNAWPRELHGGSLLIQDVAGDLYLIPDVSALDSISQKKLWAFMDDD